MATAKAAATSRPGRQIGGYTIISTASLQALLDGYHQDVRQANERAEAADARLRSAYAVEQRGEANLARLFGPLRDLGIDDRCASHGYAAEDGLACIAVYIATGEVRLSDPAGKIDAIIVSFDPLGDFAAEALRNAADFRARVALSRQSGYARPATLSMIAVPPREN